MPLSKVMVVKVCSLRGCVGCSACGAVWEDANDGEAAFAFDEGQQAVFGVFAHDGIAFPVADARAVIDDRWALADVSFSMQDAACGLAAITFSAHLGHDAGVAEEGAAVAFVASNAAVDGFVAGYGFTFFGELANDLLGAQALPKGLVYLLENRF